MNLYVSNLSFNTTDDNLRQLFEKFGAVSSAKVIIDRETGRSRGFGFVDMPDRTEAKDAMDSLNEISLGKKPLVIKEAEERSGPPGSGGFRGGSGGGNNGGNNKGNFNNRDRNRY